MRTPDFFTKPPPIMLEQLGQARLIVRYESLLESWSRVLASLAKHAGDVSRGRRIQPVAGGFSFPYGWQEDLPGMCDLNIVEDQDSKLIVVRLLEPTPRLTKADGTGWIVPDEQKRAEDALGEAQRQNTDV